MDDAESLFLYAKNPNVGPIAGWPPHKDIESSRYVIDNVFDGTECYANASGFQFFLKKPEYKDSCIQLMYLILE